MSWDPVWAAANRERRNAAKRAAYWLDPQKMREKTNAWRAAHPKENKAACVKWRKNNPGKVAAQAKRRRQRKKERAALELAAALAEKFEAQRQAAWAKIAEEAKRGYSGRLHPECGNERAA